MSLFQRIFKNAQSQAHSLVDTLEDPIKLTEQGIRDLKKDLHGAMTSLAQVKSIAIRLKKDTEDQKKLGQDYERKAMLLLQKMESGDLQKAEAEGLATEALNKKEGALQRAATLKKDYEQQQQMADQLQAKVQKLKDTITRYDNDLVTLRARARTAQSTRKINQQMSNLDSSGTIAMLEKMKNKVMEEESLAAAYGEISDASLGLDEQIDKALAEASSTQAADSLAKLKKKMKIEG
ncbi:PspA/IM30 family protein [Acidobacteria bacterium AH-259-L09]|nr:PspA/IM30 family protein [Acidobacteria bacterium AH-259-L09]